MGNKGVLAPTAAAAAATTATTATLASRPGVLALSKGPALEAGMETLGGEGPGSAAAADGVNTPWVLRPYNKARPYNRAVQ